MIIFAHSINRWIFIIDIHLSVRRDRFFVLLYTLSAGKTLSGHFTLVVLVCYYCHVLICIF